MTVDHDRIRRRVQSAGHLFGSGARVFTASEVGALLDDLDAAEHSREQQFLAAVTATNHAMAAEARAALWKETARHVLRQGREWLQFAIVNGQEERQRIHAARIQAEAAVARVRDLHRDDGRGECAECNGINVMDPLSWPCPTIQALNGEE